MVFNQVCTFVVVHCLLANPIIILVHADGQNKVDEILRVFDKFVPFHTSPIILLISMRKLAQKNMALLWVSPVSDAGKGHTAWV